MAGIDAKGSMLLLPVTYLRMIHQERLDELVAIERENALTIAARTRVPARRRLGRTIARIGASIAAEPVCFAGD